METGGREALFDDALDLLVAKIGEDEQTIGVGFPYATDASGAWRTKPASQTEGYTGEGSFGNLVLRLLDRHALGGILTQRKAPLP